MVFQSTGGLIKIMAIDIGYLETQTGGTLKKVENGKDVLFTEVLTVADGKVTTTHKASGLAGNEIGFLYPFEHLSTDINAICRRCIVHRTIVCMYLVLQHGRCSGQNIVTDQILADDRDHDTCRTNVLLNAAVDHRIL